MRVITAILIFSFLCAPLSGCLAVAAGAGAGYIYKDKEQQGKVP